MKRIGVAKKVFISNAGTNDPNKNFSVGPEHCYSEFYRRVQALNRCELISSPADAHLVLKNRTLRSAFPDEDDNLGRRRRGITTCHGRREYHCFDRTIVLHNLLYSIGSVL
jgi:hypothetical protein